MNRVDIGRCHCLSSYNPPIARKLFESLLMTSLDGQHISSQTVLSVARNSDSERL